MSMVTGKTKIIALYSSNPRKALRLGQVQVHVLLDFLPFLSSKAFIEAANPLVTTLIAPETSILLFLTTNCLLWLSFRRVRLELLGCEKMEEAWIWALLFLKFSWNFGRNETKAAVFLSSSVPGSNRMPNPNFLASASSFATLFFWAWKKIF